MSIPTLNRLRELKLGGMAQALQQQQEQPGPYAELSFTERLAMLNNCSEMLITGGSNSVLVMRSYRRQTKQPPKTELPLCYQFYLVPNADASKKSVIKPTIKNMHGV